MSTEKTARKEETEHRSYGTVIAVCISKKKGTAKQNVGEARLIENYGLEHDAHAGNWHRQVSLLDYHAVLKFNAKGGEAKDGDFGENLLVSGIDLKTLPVGTRLRCGEVLLKITQIGKTCHSHCNIYRRVGDCIMPREGVFAQVLHGGAIRVGDAMTVEEAPADDPLTAAVITLSDRSAAGEREDVSGPLAAKLLREQGYDVVEELLLPDEKEQLERELIRLCDSRQVSLIITTGGTGFGTRDVTPEATQEIAERQAPGIAEAIRYGSMQITGRAMLGRGTSVIRKRTLIVNLPGSPKAVQESLDYIMEELRHGLLILRGDPQDS